MASDQILDAQIIISDFGEAFFDGQERYISNTPNLLRPQECFFEEPLGQAVDIWTLRCSLFETLGDTTLFECLFPNKDGILEDMVSVLSPLPDRWWYQWDKRTDFFFFYNDGSWR